MHRFLRWSALGVGGAVWVGIVALLAAGVALLLVGWLWSLVSVHPLVAVGALALLGLALLTSR